VVPKFPDSNYTSLKYLMSLNRTKHKSGAKVMMIDCLECGKKISTKAKVCPHCGAVDPTVNWHAQRWLDEHG
jgi:uncharacterized OB-fold protein